MSASFNLWFNDVVGGAWYDDYDPKEGWAVDSPEVCRLLGADAGDALLLWPAAPRSGFRP